MNISIKTGAVPAQSNQPLESQKLCIPNLSSGGSDLKLTKGHDQESVDECKDSETLLGGNAFIHQTAAKHNTLRNQLSHCKKLGSMSSSKKGKNGIQKRLFH